LFQPFQMLVCIGCRRINLHLNLQTMNKIKILILEHDPNDIELLQYELKKSGLIYDFVLVDNRAKFENALCNFKPEIILSDYSLPSFDGLTAFLLKKEKAPEVPFIIVSGTIGDEKSVELIKKGVTDYVLKEKMYQIAPKIIRALKEVKEQKENKLINNLLACSEKKYRELFHLSPIPMWVYDPETFRFLDVNDATIRTYGYSLEEFRHLTLRDIRPAEDVEVFERAVQSAVISRSLFTTMLRHRKKNGELIYVSIQSNMIDFSGKKAGLVLATDVTENVTYIKAIEEQNKKMQDIAWMQSRS
jgi:PAS domain S-box-containing protein